jgi:hypothetical protein
LLWIEETIAHLHTGDFKQLDINNLIEEIDSLGKAQKNALKGQIRALIEHIRSVGKQKQGIEATSHLFLYFNP